MYLLRHKVAKTKQRLGNTAFLVVRSRMVCFLQVTWRKFAVVLSSQQSNTYVSATRQTYTIQYQRPVYLLITSSLITK